MKFTYMKSLGTFSPSVSTQMESQIDDLQGQIDTINEASDVADVVATYADLQAYDKSTLTNKDVIKVLTDSTHDNKTTYYRYLTASNDFTYIGAIESYYTKLESDAKFQDKLVNQTNIKSINGNSILGSGNLEIASYLNFPSSWPTTSSTSTKSFCDTVAADSTAVEGKMYLGEVRWNDLPASMVNAEVSVNIMKGSTASTKVIVLEMTSGNRAPYKWQYTYWNNGSNVSGWIGFQPQLTAGEGIDITNDTISNSFIITTSTVDTIQVPNGSEMIPGGLENVLTPGCYTVKLDLSAEMPGVFMTYPLEVSGDGSNVAIQILRYNANTNLNYVFSRMYAESTWTAWEVTKLQPVPQQINDTTSTSITISMLENNTMHNYGTLTSLTITNSWNTLDFVAQVNFSSGVTPTVFTPPSTNGGVYFIGDACDNGTFTPTANHRYMVLFNSNGLDVMGFVIEK